MPHLQSHISLLRDKMNEMNACRETVEHMRIIVVTVSYHKHFIKVYIMYINAP